MDWHALLPVFGLVLLLLVLAVAGMAIGVLCKRPCLRGSCGGPAVHTPQGDAISCASCPNRKRGLQATMQTTTQTTMQAAGAAPPAQSPTQA
jgi:hypothetical protein